MTASEIKGDDHHDPERQQRARHQQDAAPECHPDRRADAECPQDAQRGREPADAGPARRGIARQAGR
jgi:hypothetical protein